MKTPMLDKMLEIKDQSQICGEFLDFLKAKYDMFDRKITREDPFYPLGSSDYINNERLLAEFFGIDLEQAEKEKQMILEAEINKKKPGHCELCGTYIGEGTLKVCDQCASEYKF